MRIYNMLDIISNFWELSLQFLICPPLINLFENVSFFLFDGVLPIHSSGHLHTPSICGIVEIQDSYRSCDRLSRLDIVAIVNIWESFDEVVNIWCSIIVVLDIFESQEVWKCIFLVFPFRNQPHVSDNHIKSNLWIIIHNFSASLNSTYQVYIPNCATVHANSSIWPDLRRKSCRHWPWRYNHFHDVIWCFIHKIVVSSININAGCSDISLYFLRELVQNVC